MFVEASLFLSFAEVGGREDAMAPSLSDRLLRFLSFGQVRGRWVRERVGAAELFEQLAVACSSAGLTDLVSATVDGETVYRDASNRDLDLAPTLASLRDTAAAADGDHGARLELVARTQDEVGTYVVQLIARRVHTVDAPPIQLRIFGLLREFDVGAATGGYRDGAGSRRSQVYDRVMRRLISTGSHGDVVRPLNDSTIALARRIEEKVRLHLRTDETQAVLLPCIVRPKEIVEFEDVRRDEAGLETALFRSGFDQATYYLSLWSSALTELRASLKHVLVVDGSGRPVFHVADEPVRLVDGVTAMVPGGNLSDLGGALDVAYFGGNDFHDELLTGGSIPPSDCDGDSHAWQTIRHRELDVRPTEAPWWKRGFLTEGVSFGSQITVEI